ncbi:MAG: OmpA family protein [Deltaproteobacteria bacterium]|nr:OmpA family protein [Deltaproteobacteria bacterium]
MKLFTALIMIISLAAFGCSKDKKETTTPKAVETSGGAESTEPAVQQNQDNMGGQDQGKNPELQQVVYFEFDSSNLDDAARSRLTENAQWLKADGKRTLTIEGHTDEVGTTEYNAALGERRAGAARDYLVRMGVDQGRIRIITYGEEKPASEQDSLNRRSVFIATKK